MPNLAKISAPLVCVEMGITFVFGSRFLHASTSGVDNFKMINTTLTCPSDLSKSFVKAQKAC